MISSDAWMGVNIDEFISMNLPLLQEPSTSNPLVETEYEELLCVLKETVTAAFHVNMFSV